MQENISPELHNSIQGQRDKLVEAEHILRGELSAKQDAVRSFE